VTETAPTTIDGQPVIGIHGAVPVPGSPHATYTYSGGGSATIRLSHWGETVSLTPPANAIPDSKLEP